MKIKRIKNSIEIIRPVYLLIQKDTPLGEFHEIVHHQATSQCRSEEDIRLIKGDILEPADESDQYTRKFRVWRKRLYIGNVSLKLNSYLSERYFRELHSLERLSNA